jgi:hypothetical protein
MTALPRPASVSALDRFRKVTLSPEERVFCGGRWRLGEHTGYCRMCPRLTCRQDSVAVRCHRRRGRCGHRRC